MLHSLRARKRTMRKREMGTRKITLITQAWREGRTYVAYAPELDVASCGRTLRRAHLALREAVRLFLEDAAARGVLGQILAEAGFARRGNTYRFRRVLSRETLRLALPRS